MALNEAVYLLLAFWMIVSGLDDLWIDFCYLFGEASRFWRRRRSTLTSQTVPPPGDQADLPQAKIALWIPAWREDAVIARMLAHNVATIRYSNYHIFTGTYPNDEATLDVLRELENQYPNLHVSLTPHDGPTSKADNLNWIYQNLCLVEEQIGNTFDIIVIHDSEDLIHPDEFRWLNYYTRSFDFVQIPVLALPTPWWQFTHGIYCDEFAETQQKDLPVRNRLGGFCPSCGVGTGYRRDALSRLAEAESNRLFEPDSLTEDYLNGLRMHRLGMRQIYLPVAWVQGQPVATREFFPQNFWAAVRQRTRWVTGIALQTWAKIGWSRDWRENYWLLRDRKGLIGNPLSLVANLLLLAGLAGATPRLSENLLVLAGAGIGLQAIRMTARMFFTARVYGIAYALLVPLRIPWANAINSFATLNAIWRYVRARVRKERLVWLKTEHNYPNRQALATYTRRIGEVFVDHGWLTEAEVSAALAAKGPEERLGEYLVRTGQLSRQQVYEALALLTGLPTETILPDELEVPIARSVPRSIMRRACLTPVRWGRDSLVIATSETPSDRVVRLIRRYTKRDPLFVLVTPENLELLQRKVEQPLAMAASA